MTREEFDGLIALAKELARPNVEVRTPGVYLLWNDGELVYIGCSGACQSRINGHITGGYMAFDSWTIIHLPGTRSEREKVERDLIAELQPPINVAGLGKVARAHYTRAA